MQATIPTEYDLIALLKETGPWYTCFFNDMLGLYTAMWDAQTCPKGAMCEVGTGTTPESAAQMLHIRTNLLPITKHPVSLSTSNLSLLD